MFSGLLGELSPEEAVALMSALVFQVGARRRCQQTVQGGGDYVSAVSVLPSGSVLAMPGHDAHHA